MMDRQEEISETMKDAGCSDDCIRRFFECKDKGEMRKADRILEEQRKELLEELHASQRKIDCLDYLRWEMGKKKAYEKKRVYSTFSVCSLVSFFMRRRWREDI